LKVLLQPKKRTVEECVQTLKRKKIVDLKGVVEGSKKFELESVKSPQILSEGQRLLNVELDELELTWLWQYLN
jgi:hypothetical protein